VLCYAYRGRLRKDYAKVLWLLPLCAGFLILRHLYVASPQGNSAPELLRFLFMVFPRVVFHYLAVLLAPLSLETWPRALTAAPYWGLSLAGGLAGAAALFLLPVRRRVTAFCLCWFLLMLAPRVPAILITQIMMDKWVFIASPAVFIILLTLLMKLREHRLPYIRAIPPAAVAAVCLFWATLAHAEVRLRGSDEKNYLWSIRSTPHSFISYRLGIIYLQNGRVQEAVGVLRPLVENYAWNPDFHNAYGMALWHSGRRREAWALMQDLARRCPENKAIQENAAGMRARLTGAPGR